MAKTANLDGEVTEGTTKETKIQITSQVSEQFHGKVRDTAKSQFLTVSTFLRYSVEKAAGRNPDVPEKDSSQESFALSVSIDEPTKLAIDDLLKASDPPITKAQFLRQVAADSTGYDLSQEPERSAPGEGMKKRMIVANNQDAVLMALYSTDPELVKRIVEGQNKTLADVGILVEA